MEPFETSQLPFGKHSHGQIGWSRLVRWYCPVKNGDIFKRSDSTVYQVVFVDVSFIIVQPIVDVSILIANGFWWKIFVKFADWFNHQFQCWLFGLPTTTKSSFFQLSMFIICQNDSKWHHPTPTRFPVAARSHFLGGSVRGTRPEANDTGWRSSHVIFLFGALMTYVIFILPFHPIPYNLDKNI